MKDFEWEYCTFKAIQMEEGEGANSFFMGYHVGDNIFS